MRNYICGSLLILFLCGNAFADASIQKVEIAPLTGGVSFSTVEFAPNGINWNSWVTCPSVEMIGRKRLILQNTSNTVTIYLTGVSGSTARGTIAPNQSVSFACSSNLHIYASSNSVTSLEVWEIR